MTVCVDSVTIMFMVLCYYHTIRNKNNTCCHLVNTFFVLRTRRVGVLRQCLMVLCYYHTIGDKDNTGYHLVNTFCLAAKEGWGVKTVFMVLCDCLTDKFR